MAVGVKASRTKLWALIAGIGSLATIAVAWQNGTMQLTEAIPAAVAVISGIVTAWKMRDAVQKSGPAQ